MLYDKKWELKVPVKPKLAGWQRVLLNAADLIDQKGWIKGRHKSPYGYCARGAILYSRGSLYSKVRAIFKLRAHLTETYYDRVSIPLWNDHRVASYQVTMIMRDAAGQ